MSGGLLFNSTTEQWQRKLDPAVLNACLLVRQAVLHGRRCNTTQLVGRSPTFPRARVQPKGTPSEFYFAAQVRPSLHVLQRLSCCRPWHQQRLLAGTWALSDHAHIKWPAHILCCTAAVQHCCNT